MRMRRGIPLSQWVWLRELKVVSGRFSYRALSSSDEASTSEAKKRKVTYATYQKWKSELDRDCQTVSWLDCESKVVAGKRIGSCDAVCVPSSRLKSGVAETLAIDGLSGPTQYAPATYATMLGQTSTLML